MDQNEQRAFLIASLYSTGTTLDEIAAQFNVSRERIRQILKRMGIHGRPRCRHEADPIKVCGVVGQAESIEDCARAAGTTVNRARHVLEVLGKWDENEARWRSTRQAAKALMGEQKKARLIARLRAIAKRLNRTPSQFDIQRAGMCPTALFYWFGSIREAQRLAGLEPNGVGYQGHKRVRKEKAA